MAAAAVSSLACPLRRSSRLTSRRKPFDDNELTPRALRALKRQRLALDLPARAKRRRKENTPPSPVPAPPADPEPLSPLTPSPESPPSIPGHDRPPSPPHDPLPSPALAQSSPDPFPPPLDTSLDTLIPFDVHPHFHPDIAVQIPPPPQPLDLQDSFQQPPLYVPPPVFVRDREINIWKLACQERVDCLCVSDENRPVVSLTLSPRLRRYGIDYIKALVQSQARSPSSPHPSSSQTKFRLYTPASYTYSSTSWGSPSGSRKPFPLDDDDPEAPWPIDDADWVDADVDMEDEDEDDYEDEDDPDAVREGESTLEAVQALVISDALPMQVDPSKDLIPPRTSDTTPRPLTPTPHVYLPPPLTPPTLPPLSSLHVPLLSEPPRAFMGRGTPPDRRRLIEWSGSGPTGIGPPLYLSPVPQRPSPDIPMSVDPPSQPLHTNGEWTSFLFSVLESDGVPNPQSPGSPTWYELGLASVPANALDLSLGQRTAEQSVEDASSSTLRYALG